MKIGPDTVRDNERMRSIDRQMAAGEGLTFDCNRSWLPSEAIAVLNTNRDLNRVIKQSCEMSEVVPAFDRPPTEFAPVQGRPGWPWRWLGAAGLDVSGRGAGAAECRAFA